MAVTLWTCAPMTESVLSYRRFCQNLVPLQQQDPCLWSWMPMTVTMSMAMMPFWILAALTAKIFSYYSNRTLVCGHNAQLWWILATLTAKASSHFSNVMVLSSYSCSLASFENKEGWECLYPSRKGRRRSCQLIKQTAKNLRKGIVIYM